MTTEGGLDVAGQRQRIAAATQRLSAAGVRVSLFIDPDPRQIEAAVEVGAPAIELHTGSYANASNRDETARQLELLQSAATKAHSLGLQVNAGHGLDYTNVAAIAAIPEIAELNIGHAIVAHALFAGLSDAVREMKRIMEQARR